MKVMNQKQSLKKAASVVSSGFGGAGYTMTYTDKVVVLLELPHTFNDSVINDKQL